MRFHRRFLIGASVGILIGIWFWMSSPRPLDEFSTRSNGKTDVHLGPVVNNTVPSLQAVNHCQSNGWTRSCYKSEDEMARAGRSTQSAFNSGSCEVPTRIVGVKSGEKQTIYVVGRSSLIELTEISRDFAAKTIVTGSCEVNVYNMNDPFEPVLLATLVAHRTHDVEGWKVPLGVFQK